MPAETPRGLQPLYLLADSQLLFWNRGEELFLRSLREGLTGDSPAAAYIGASNGDQKEFYSIFEGAMDAIGITDRRMIESSFNAEDRAFLERAQLILLAGGDVRRGWSTFEKTGMKELILARYAQGATLVGVSAGAVQLGHRAILETPESSALELIDVFNLVPAIIDVHDERREWANLSGTIQTLEGTITGLGIPTGGGIVLHSDGTVEAIRRPAHEFRADGTRVSHSLLMPPEDG